MWRIAAGRWEIGNWRQGTPYPKWDEDWLETILYQNKLNKLAASKGRAGHLFPKLISHSSEINQPKGCIDTRHSCALLKSTSSGTDIHASWKAWHFKRELNFPYCFWFVCLFVCFFREKNCKYSAWTPFSFFFCFNKNKTRPWFLLFKISYLRTTFEFCATCQNRKTFRTACFKNVCLCPVSFSQNVQAQARVSALHATCTRKKEIHPQQKCEGE